MSERKQWPIWVTKTLLYEAHVTTLFVAGFLSWVALSLGIFGGFAQMEPWYFWMCLCVILLSFGILAAGIYAISQTRAQRNLLYNAGRVEGDRRFDEAKGGLNWRTFVWMPISAFPEIFDPFKPIK